MFRLRRGIVAAVWLTGSVTVAPLARAQGPDAAPAATDSAVGVPKKKKKGLLDRVKDVANDKTVRQAATLAGCSGMVPGASTALMVSGQCAGGGLMGGAAGAAMSGAGGVGSGGSTGGGASAALPPGLANPSKKTAERSKVLGTALGEARQRGVGDGYLNYLVSDATDGTSDFSTIDDGQMKALLERVRASRPGDLPPAKADVAAATAPSVPLISRDDPAYDAPASDETKARLENAVKEAKKAGVSKVQIEGNFYVRKDGGGTSMKKISEGDARTIERSLRVTTAQQLDPRGLAATQAPSVASLTQPSAGGGLPPAIAAMMPGAGSASPGTAAGAAALSITGDLTSKAGIQIRGIAWSDQFDLGTQMALVSQLAPVVEQLNRQPGTYKISLFSPASSAGDNMQRQRHGQVLSAMSQAGLNMAQVRLSRGKIEASDDSRIEIMRQ